MASFNKVILIGRVTQEPELRFTPSGKPVANFTLAVDSPRQNAKGEKEADFISIVAWQKLAEICAHYLTKGKLIAIEGRLQTRSYETQDGQRRKTYEVVASTMQMLDRAKAQTGSAQEAAEAPVKETAPESDDFINLEEMPF